MTDLMDTEAEILRGQFEILPTKKSFFVTLTRKYISYSKGADGMCPCVGRNRSATLKSIQLADIYGAKAFRGPEGDIAGYFQVYSCPMFKKRRVRRKICFKVMSSDDDEVNTALAEKWVRTILWLVKEPETNFDSIQGAVQQFSCFIQSRMTASPKIYFQ